MGGWLVLRLSHWEWRKTEGDDSPLKSGFDDHDDNHDKVRIIIMIMVLKIRTLTWQWQWRWSLELWGKTEGDDSPPKSRYGKRGLTTDDEYDGDDYDHDYRETDPDNDNGEFGFMKKTENDDSSPKSMFGVCRLWWGPWWWWFNTLLCNISLLSGWWFPLVTTWSWWWSWSWEWWCEEKQSDGLTSPNRWK